MAPAVPEQLAVRLPENEEVARCLLEKRRSMAEQPGVKENVHLTLATVYRNVCASKKPIRTLKDLPLIRNVPQVTEEAALAVIDLYPTLFSLAWAYSMLDGNTHAQEEMLKNKSKMVNAGAGRNIFKLVWGEG